MKIIFFGSDDFAALHLEYLLKSQHSVVACVTKPDKPQGRGLKMGISPIKEIVLEHSIPCLQPASLKDESIVAVLKSYQADLFVIVAYGRLLTQEILDLPKVFAVNVHGSLLPHYRGAAPIHWAILNGDQQTGVTVQKMVLTLDAGDIIAQEVMTIGLEENTGELRRRMALAGAQLLVKTVDDIQAGSFELKVQGEKAVSYAPKLSKDMGKIDWNQPAQKILNQIRGLQPWPGAFTVYQGKSLKIIRARLTELSSQGKEFGEVMSIQKQGFVVACSDLGILIEELHPEAGKIMLASSFVAGHRLQEGFLFQ